MVKTVERLQEREETEEIMALVGEGTLATTRAVPVQSAQSE